MVYQNKESIDNRVLADWSQKQTPGLTEWITEMQQKCGFTLKFQYYTVTFPVMQ